MNRISTLLVNSLKAFPRNQMRVLSSTSRINSEQKAEEYVVDYLEQNSITPFKGRKGETIERLKARLIYQSRKRGMLENCVILSNFAAKHLSSMDEHQLQLYDRLINSPSNDWDLYYWATGVRETPKEHDHIVMQMLKEHVKNTEGEARVGQPNLY